MQPFDRLGVAGGLRQDGKGKVVHDPMALSSEAATGLRQENTSKRSELRFRFKPEAGLACGGSAKDMSRLLDVTCAAHPARSHQI
jgi:hypothetical protein